MVHCNGCPCLSVKLQGRLGPGSCHCLRPSKLPCVYASPTAMVLLVNHSTTQSAHNSGAVPAPVYFHNPWYTTWGGFKTDDCTRQALEPLLNMYGADLVYNGELSLNRAFKAQPGLDLAPFCICT